MTLKGILFGAWAFATLLGATSASLPHPTSVEALTVGDVLPKMKTLDVGGRISTPADKTPAYRLIHFWAAYNAESRAMNQVWDHFFKANPHTAIRYEGISVDPEEAVWARTITWDQVDPNRQHCLPQGEQEEYSSRAGLTTNFHTYLLDQQGVIVAVDPTPSEITKYL